MKILLLNPPILHPVRFPGPNSTWLQHELAPPLGLMSISATIKRAGYTDVQLLNGQTPEGLTDGALVRALTSRRPDLVGITTATQLYYNVIRLCRLIKAHAPDTRVVLGGPHLTLYGPQAVGRPEVDFGVVGEGELPFLELLQALDAGGDLSQVAGLLWKRGAEVVQNPPRPIGESLDALPMPDFSLFDLRQHRVPYDDLHPSGMIISSRGCPFACSFCSRNYPRYRARSAASVVDEMQAFERMGYRSVAFYDEMFNLSKPRVLEICRLIRERALGLAWSFRGRVDRFDDELARAMAQAGCIRAHFGVESGDQAVLDLTKKRITLEQSREAFRLCRAHGIQTVGFFVLGLPGETLPQARKTVAFALELDPDYVVFTSLLPQPGSPIYEQALAAGAFPDYFEAFAREPVPDLVYRPWETGMTEKEVFALMGSALARFYFRPRYLLRRLRGLKSLDDFTMKAAMGLKLASRLVQSRLS